MLIDKQVFNIPETACLLGISSGSVYQLIHSKKLQAYKQNNYAWRIPDYALQQYIDEQVKNTFLKNNCTPH